jgi:hypothetical protein
MQKLLCQELVTDGDYSIVYSLSGSNSLNQSMTISVRAGVASFQIPFANS